MSKLILIVDDEESIRTSLKGILEDEGYQVLLAENGTDALDLIREEVPDLVLLDIWMPGMDGIQTLERIKNLALDLTVVMMSGHGTIETAVKATRIGAFDFIEKPFSLDKLLITTANALNYKELRKENEALRHAALREHELVGVSAALEVVRSQVRRVAPASTPVLIQGENGVGKELVARAIHYASTRCERPFVSVNCMAVPEQLLGDELFGHERGAFAGAISQKRGRLDLADGGTLFLDDIQELSLKSQGEILRIITEQCFERPGGSRPVRADVRIIAASSRPLNEAAAAGTFREDLYLHLQVVPLSLEPLRKRPEDIPHLVKHFIHQFHRREGWEVKDFDESALAYLQRYAWPGNVRELKNVVERVLIMASGPVVSADDLPELVSSGENPASGSRQSSRCDGVMPMQAARDHFERDYLQGCMKQCGWDLDKASSGLGLERAVLQRKLTQYGLAPDTDVP